MKEKFKPFDWTFTTSYQGTENDKFRIEKSDQSLNKFKLMQREKILFYHDLTLFEDELHDHGISSCTVKIVSLCLHNLMQVFKFYNQYLHLNFSG